VTFDLGAVVETLTEFSASTIASVIVLLALNIAIVSIRLWRLLAHFGARVDYLTSFRANVAGLMSSLVMIALAGAILGRQIILRRAGVGVSSVGLISTYERIVVAAVGAGLCALGGTILFGARAVEGVFVELPIWQIALALIIAIGFAVFVSTSGYELRLVRGLVGRRGVARVLEIAGFTLLGQALSLCGYAVALHAIGVEASWPAMLAAAAIVSFAASIPISVNGWGVREIAAIYAFGQLGVASAEAMAVSVLFGVCSTIVVLLTAPVLRSWRRSDPEADSGVLATDAPRPAQVLDSLQRPAAMILGYLAGVLVFFQIKAALQGGEITVNLADPLALVALTLLIVGWLGGGRAPIRLPGLAWFWFAAIVVVILVGFVIGVARFGVTGWALNNRLIGGAMLLGYVAIGALLAAAWGRHGTRRLMEIVATTSVAIILTVMIVDVLQSQVGVFFIIESNFQGFSANRNTFAFQIVVAICCAIATGGARRDARDRVFWAAVLAILFIGLWQTQSKTGMMVGAMVLGFALLARLGDRRTVAWLSGGCATFGIAWMVVRGYQPSASVELKLDNMLGNVSGLNIESLQQRWFSVEAAIKLWAEHPIFGAGLGAFMNKVMEEGVGPLVIHATPAWVLTEFGIVGALLIFGPPLLGLIIIARRWRGRQQPRQALLLTLGPAFLLFGLLHDLSYQRLFWLMLGAALAGTTALRTGCVKNSLKSGASPRVLHVITSLNRGGAETMLIELLREERARDGDGKPRSMVASVASGGAHAPTVHRLGVPLVELGFTRRMPSIVGLFRLARFIRSRRPDVVQGWMYHGDLVALIGLLLSGRWRETRLFWGIRCSDMDLSRYGAALRLIVRICAFLSRFTDGVIANSDAGRRVHRALGYAPPIFEVVPNGVDTGRFRPDATDRAVVREELGIAEDARVMMHVARVDPMKNHTGLLAAVAAVPGVTLVLVGRDTEALPKQSGVVALGLRDDVDRILRGGDGIVLSSGFGEGFPNALAEGMASGLVPITTDVGDARTISGGVGWVVPPSDHEALVDAIQSFVSLPKEALADSQKSARDRIEACFSVARAARGFERIHVEASFGARRLVEKTA
jgi:glycosyltransferase involved in cell wall biosynthesis